MWSDENWAGGSKHAAIPVAAGTRVIGIRQPDADVFSIPVQSEKGFSAELKIALAAWQ